MQIVSQLGARGVNFRSLSDPIDTESAGGRLVLHMMSAKLFCRRRSRF
jgi:DNA invertase Pin-like site-specific DNA recombinase